MFIKRTFLAFFAIATLALVGCNAQTTESSLVLSGHRGARVIAPENTMASIDSCAKYGIEFAEVDLVISKDSVFYILHDRTLDRTTNGTGSILDWNSTDIDTLDAGSWFGEAFEGLRVPRFEDVLRSAKAQGVGITVDYRNGDLKKLVELVKAEGMEDNCTFVFSRREKFVEFREVAPELKTVQGYVRGAADYQKVRSSEMKPDIAVISMDSLTLDLSRQMKEDGIKVLVLALGVDNDAIADMNKAIALEADIIATDLPEVMARSRK